MSRLSFATALAAVAGAVVLTTAPAPALAASSTCNVNIRNRVYDAPLVHSLESNCNLVIGPNVTFRNANLQIVADYVYASQSGSAADGGTIAVSLIDVKFIGAPRVEPEDLQQAATAPGLADFISIVATEPVSVSVSSTTATITATDAYVYPSPVAVRFLSLYGYGSTLTVKSSSLIVQGSGSNAVVQSFVAVQSLRSQDQCSYADTGVNVNIADCTARTASIMRSFFVALFECPGSVSITGNTVTVGGDAPSGFGGTTLAPSARGLIDIVMATCTTGDVVVTNNAVDYSFAGTGLNTITATIDKVWSFVSIDFATLRKRYGLTPVDRSTVATIGTNTVTVTGAPGSTSFAEVGGVTAQLQDNTWTVSAQLDSQARRGVRFLVHWAFASSYDTNVALTDAVSFGAADLDAAATPDDQSIDATVRRNTVTATVNGGVNRPVFVFVQSAPNNGAVTLTSNTATVAHATGASGVAASETLSAVFLSSVVPGTSTTTISAVAAACNTFTIGSAAAPVSACLFNVTQLGDKLSGVAGRLPYIVTSNIVPTAATSTATVAVVCDGADLSYTDWGVRSNRWDANAEASFVAAVAAAKGARLSTVAVSQGDCDAMVAAAPTANRLAAWAPLALLGGNAGVSVTAAATPLPAATAALAVIATTIFASLLL